MDLLFHVLRNSDIPGLIQNIGLAALSMLIPVAIAIFGPDNRDFKELDKHVLLDHVIRARQILVYCALVFLPALFWAHASFGLRFILLVLWGLGMYLLISILVRSYQWLKGNKFPLRFDFLKTMTQEKDMAEAWDSVWTNELNPQNEKEFFEIFSARIDALVSHE